MSAPSYSKVGAILTRAADISEEQSVSWFMRSINLAITGDKYGATASQADEYLLAACGAIVARVCYRELEAAGISIWEGEPRRSPLTQPAFKWHQVMQGDSHKAAAALLRRCADDAFYLAESGVTL